MRNSYIKSSVWVTVILVGGYLLAFIKEAIIANYYGVTSVVDAYTIAIQTPVNIFSFVACAIRAVVIPLYSELYYNKNVQEANKFASNLITFTFLIAIGFVVVGELCSGLLTTLFAPGFDQETHDLSALLLRITLPTMLFSVVIDVLTGVLNVHKKFVLPSLAVYFLNLSIILSIFFLHTVFGIAAACIGQVIGSILQMVYLYVLIRKNYSYKPFLDMKDDTLKRAIKMSGPTIWSISIAEVNAIVNRVVASFLFVGSIAALGYASKINNVFMTFFITAVSVIIYPLYAESTAKKDYVQLSSRVNFTLSLFCALLLPLMVVLIFFRREIIELAFARGAFGPEAVEITMNLFAFYSIGLVFLAFRDTLTKVFLSMKDTKTIAWNSTIGVILNIILNLTLPYLWGVNGLAIATSVTAIFISIRLLALLKKKHQDINLESFYKNLKGILLSTLLLVALLFLAQKFGVMTGWIKLIVGGTVSAIIYFLLLVLFKTPIVNEVYKFIKER